MGVILPSDLSTRRRLARWLLPDACELTAEQRVSDGRGGYTLTWATVATVACKVSPVAGREEVLGEKVTALGDWLIQLPYGTVVMAANRIVHAGNVYEIVWLPDQYSNQVVINAVVTRTG